MPTRIRLSPVQRRTQVTLAFLERTVPHQSRYWNYYEGCFACLVTVRNSFSSKEHHEDPSEAV
jgi:hypothetical protein